MLSLDSGLKGHDDFLAVCVMLGSASHGPCADRLAQVLEVPRAKVRSIGQRLREVEIWAGRHVIGNGWTDPESGGLGFLMDVLLYQGLLERAE